MRNCIQYLFRQNNTKYMQHITKECVACIILYGCMVIFCLLFLARARLDISIVCEWRTRARARSTIPKELQNKSTLCNAQWNQIARVNEDFYQNNNTTTNGEYCHLEQSTRIVESVNNCFLVVLLFFPSLFLSLSESSAENCTPLSIVHVVVRSVFYKIQLFCHQSKNRGK